MNWTTVGPSGEEIDVFTVEGTDPNIPPEERRKALLESIERMKKRRQEVSGALYESLLIDGIEHQVSDDDIADLASSDTHSKFMRAIVIELMLCLRLRRAKEKEEHARKAAHAEGALSLGG